MSDKVVLIASDENISHGFGIGLDLDSHLLRSRAHIVTDSRFIESVDGHDLQGVKRHVRATRCLEPSRGEEISGPLGGLAANPALHTLHPSRQRRTV